MTQFWVIFDTSTKQAYYQDVHNLLALPPGAVLRYEYRENWLSNEAKRLAADKVQFPRKVLLVYAQWTQYQKRGQSPQPPPPLNEMIFIATRLAEMQPIVIDGIDYFFDLKLGGYPAQTDKLLMEIIEPLAAKAETPYHKWVAISDRVSSLNRLSTGKGERNWQDLIDRIGNQPSQFAGDSFWRVRGIFQTKKGLAVDPNIETEFETTGNKKVPRKTFSFYSLFEGQSYFAEILSYAPRPFGAGGQAAGAAPRFVRLSTDPIETVTVESEPVLDLRSYTGHSIRLVPKWSENIADRSCRFNLRSNITPEEWPTGPNITILLKVKKKTLQLILALFSGIVGAVSLLIATRIWDSSVILSIGVAAIGTLLIVIAYLLYTRKLSFTP